MIPEGIPSGCPPQWVPHSLPRSLGQGMGKSPRSAPEISRIAEGKNYMRLGNSVTGQPAENQEIRFWHVRCNLFSVPVLRERLVAWLVKSPTHKFASLRVESSGNRSSLLSRILWHGFRGPRFRQAAGSCPAVVGIEKQCRCSQSMFPEYAWGRTGSLKL